MKAKAVFIANYEEIEQAERLDLEPPDVIPETDWLRFRLSEVTHWFIANNGDIVIYLCGQKWSLEYNKDIYNLLEKEFENEKR